MLRRVLCVIVWANVSANDLFTVSLMYVKEGSATTAFVKPHPLVFDWTLFTLSVVRGLPFRVAFCSDGS